MSSNYDELIAIALGEIKAPETRTEAEVFLDDLGIEGGNNWVNAVRVYWVYLKWCEITNRIAVDRRTFLKGMQKRFTRHCSHSKYYFKLKAEDFDLPKEEWYAAMRHYLREKKWQKQQRKRKQTLKLKKREARKEKRLAADEQLKIRDSINDSSQE